MEFHTSIELIQYICYSQNVSNLVCQRSRQIKLKKYETIKVNIERLAISNILLIEVYYVECFDTKTTGRLQSKIFSNVLLHLLPKEGNPESTLKIFLIPKHKSWLAPLNSKTKQKIEATQSENKRYDTFKFLVV